MHLVLISEEDAAVTTKVGFDSADYNSVTIAATGLAGAEEVNIFMDVNGTWVTAVDSSGTAYKLTAAITMLEFVAGPRYGVTKDATVADATVVAILGVGAKGV